MDRESLHIGWLAGHWKWRYERTRQNFGLMFFFRGFYLGYLEF